MIAFWIAATGLSAVTAGLVLRGAAKARPVDDADTRLEPHRRRLAEVERLALDGLLSQDELKAARAEAGRGLLAAADQAEHWTRDGAGPRKAVVATVGAACVAAGFFPGAEESFFGMMTDFHAETKTPRSRRGGQ